MVSRLNLNKKMKNKILWGIFFLFMKTFLTPLGGKSLPDSLITIENVYVFSISNPEKSQAIIDRLREVGDEKLALPFELDWAQADLFFNTSKFRLASFYYEKVKEYEEVKSNRKFQMGLLSTLLECYRNNNDLEKTMKTALNLLKIAEEETLKDEMGRSYMYMADVFYAHKDKVQAHKYYELAESLLQEAGNIHYLYQFYISYAGILFSEGLYKEALEKVIKGGELLPDVAADPYMTNEGYDDFEYCRFNAFAANVYMKSGEIAKAQASYEDFLTREMSSLVENKILIVPYLLTIKAYKEALSIAHEREKQLRQQTDTIGDNMISVKNYLYTAYYGLGDKERAIAALNEQLAIAEQLRTRQLNTETQELAVIYETEKKEVALQQKVAEADWHKKLSYTSLAVILLVLVILFILLYIQRNTEKQNRLMVKQIKDMQAYRLKQEEESETLFSKLKKLMEKDYLYRNSSCSREMILEKLGIDRNCLLQLLHENKIISLPDFINEYRLQEAIGLLEQNPEMNLEEIATTVGFGTLRSFQRQFKNNYNMSPSEYRKLML